MAGVLLKIRHVGNELKIPESKKVDGLEVMEADAAGQLVRVTDPVLALACEKMVGSLSLSIFPCGVIVELDEPHASLNGLWVQRGVYDLAVKNQNGKSASAR